MKKYHITKKLLVGVLSLSLSLTTICSGAAFANAEELNADDTQTASEAPQEEEDVIELQNGNDNTTEAATEAATEEAQPTEAATEAPTETATELDEWITVDPTEEATADDAQPASELGKTVVTLGADLSDKQRATVLELLGLTEEDLLDCIVVEITHDDEVHYLEEYLPAKVIGNHALSSIRLDPTEEGSGLSVTTKNINYCKEDMYINALATAGVKDAEVTVVGPFEISGTAGLVGTMLAYSAMTGEQVNEAAADAAASELVATGHIADLIGDTEKASQFVGYVKNQVVVKDLSDEKDIREVVDEAAKEFNVELNEEETNEIVTAMAKISKLDLDWDSLYEQAKGLYDKISNMGIDLNAKSGFFQKILDFFGGLFDKIKELFQ